MRQVFPIKSNLFKIFCLLLFQNLTSKKRGGSRINSVGIIIVNEIFSVIS